MASSDRPAASIGDGRTVVTTAGTRVQLSTASVECRAVAITAFTSNTNPVTVGASTVVGALATRRGTPLAAGATIVLAVDNLSDVWVDSITNGEGVTYTYEV